MSPGRKAALPIGDLPGAPSGGTIGPLNVTLTLEDDPSHKFDLSRMPGPRQVRAELAAAVVILCSSAKGVRRRAALGSIRVALSSFLRWVDLWNQEHRNDEDLRIEGLADFTPFHLRRYRTYVEANHTANTTYVYYGRVTGLVRIAPGVSEETRREASRRRGQSAPPVQKMQRYSKIEFTEIRNAARRCMEAAHARITASYTLAQQADDPLCPDALRAQALHEVIAHGSPQSEEGLRALGGSGKAIAGGGGQAPARRHLFLTAAEAYAATVLIACQRGLNLAPIITASVPVEHEPGVAQLDLDKPRRGPAHRFWPEIFVDAGGVDTMGTRALQLVEEATEPLRDYLAIQGRPTQRLIGYWPSTCSTPLFGTPDPATRAKADWVPSGMTIRFRRLRKSVPGHGVTKESADHSPDTHLLYVRSDPVALLEHREAAAQGADMFLKHTHAKLAIRIAEDSKTNPATDAVLVNCSDPLHRPDTGQPCTTGYYSFLDCLACSNAATVPRLLPRQLAALRVLETLRDSIGEAWERRFASHYATLAAIIERHTPTERKLADNDAEQHLPTILTALRHEVPR